MTRSLGISLQPDGFAYALLDGSAKRYAVKASGAGRFDTEARDPSRAMGRALARLLKEGGVGKVEEVVATVPSLDTVLRELSLPFSDREKVQQVLKFEVESDLYHLDIEDVLCDFLEVEDERATSTILVAAEPKAHVGQALDVLEEAGQEALVLDLDLGALAGAIREIQARAEAPGGQLEAFLYLGAYSSLLVVVAGTSLRAARAIKVGWREMGRGLEDRPAPGVEEAAEEAVEDMEVTPGGETGEETADAGEEPAEESGRPFGADPVLPAGLTLEGVLGQADPEHRAAMIRRLASEVRRGLAAVASAPVARLHLLGAEVPGLDEALQARLGIPAARLDEAFAPEDGPAPDALAMGAALRGLGVNASRMNFRQEEFRVTRGLERVEGPLTWALVGLIAFLLVDGVTLFQRGNAKKAATDLVFARAQGLVSQLNDHLRPDDPEEWRIRTSFEGTSVADLDRLRVLRARVTEQKKKLDTLVGTAGVEMPPDCLEAWRLVTWALERELGDYNQFGNRWMLESLEFISNESRSRSEANVACKIGLTLFGADALAIDRKFEDVARALGSQPWSLEEAAIPAGISNADVPGARTATVLVSVSPAKAREAGL